MARMSKSVREEAIEALLVCADDHAEGYGAITTYQLLGYESPASAVADDAWNATVADDAWNATGGPAETGKIGGRDPLTRYLEAAGLLIEGWSPGEPVIRLGGAS